MFLRATRRGATAPGLGGAVRVPHASRRSSTCAWTPTSGRTSRRTPTMNLFPRAGVPGGADPGGGQPVCLPRSGISHRGSGRRVSASIRSWTRFCPNLRGRLSSAWCHSGARIRANPESRQRRDLARPAGVRALPGVLDTHGYRRDSFPQRARIPPAACASFRGMVNVSHGVRLPLPGEPVSNASA